MDRRLGRAVVRVVGPTGLRMTPPVRVQCTPHMTTTSDPLPYLKRLHRAGSHNDVVQMIRDRDSVLERYGPVFSDPAHLAADELTDFLHFENNRHWWGLHRHATGLASRIEVVRQALGELFDEATPLAERVDGIGPVPDLTPAVWSPMLLVAKPDEYAVWSGISESAMRRLGLWPETSESDGSTYAAANQAMHTVAADLDVDLWTLDALWWAAEKEHDPAKHFVTRTRPAPRRGPEPRTTGGRPAARKAASARAPATEATFVCRNCWTTKPVRLAGDSPELCVDCS